MTKITYSEPYDIKIIFSQRSSLYKAGCDVMPHTEKDMKYSWYRQSLSERLRNAWDRAVSETKASITGRYPLHITTMMLEGDMTETMSENTPVPVHHCKLVFNARADRRRVMDAVKASKPEDICKMVQNLNLESLIAGLKLGSK